MTPMWILSVDILQEQTVIQSIEYIQLHTASPCQSSSVDVHGCPLLGGTQQSQQYHLFELKFGNRMGKVKVYLKRYIQYKLGVKHFGNILLKSKK